MSSMARSPRELRRLAAELRALTPEERERVIEQATRAAEPVKPLPKDLTLPVLRGGTRWIGGTLTREDIYGDDGR
jgi:hypothetical protein